jgi:CRISPR type I-E-associated protein CasB/Cse2
MSQTGDFLARLANDRVCTPGARARLRTLAGEGLDEDTSGFDIFTGLWWPVRKRGPRGPRREVAWLVSKLFAACPVPDGPGHTLASQLAKCRPRDAVDRKRFTQRFDRMLMLPVSSIEYGLRWALDVIASHNLSLDWVKLTDDLSFWERESTRLRWAKDFLGIKSR